MISRCMRAAWLLALAPAAALAFDAVDIIPYPSTGVFPAYDREIGTAPIGISAQAGWMYDDNVLRRPSGGQSENIVRVGAGARVDQRVYGRQSVVLDVRGDYYHYGHFDDLSYFGYGLLGEWRWELGNQLSGTLGYARRRFQADISETQAAVEDLITGDRVYASAGYRFAADWRLRLGADWAGYDRPTRVEAETESTSVTVGLDYVTPLLNAIGIEYRGSRGDAPVSAESGIPGVFVDNDYIEKELAAVLVYNLGTTLRVRGRFGHTERSYTVLPGRDFDGATWRAGVEWLPGMKTILSFETYKEPRSVIDIAAHHVVLRGSAFGIAWAPLAKVSLYTRFINERRIHEGDPAVAAGGLLLDETLRTMRFGVGWEPRRHWYVGAAMDHGERESNELGRDYDYNAYVFNVRFLF